MRAVAWSIVGVVALAAWPAPAGASSAASEVRPKATSAAVADPVAEAIVHVVRARMGEDAVVTVTDLSISGRILEPPFAAVPAPGARTGGAIRFQIVGSDRGRVRGLGWATASVQVAVEHVRARQLVAKGHTLSDEDLDVTDAAVAGVPLRWLPRLRDVRGARVLTSLAPGVVLTKSAVASRPAVRSGETVRATARIGAVQVEAHLVAVQDGDPGATVRVVNRESRRELRARVIEHGLVEVVDE